MKSGTQTEEQLIQELKDLRRKIAGLEKSETDRKRTEEALRESEEKYRSLTSTEDSMYFVDRRRPVSVYEQGPLVEAWPVNR